MKLWDRSQKLIFALKGLPISYKPASIIGFNDCICYIHSYTVHCESALKCL